VEEYLELVKKANKVILELDNRPKDVHGNPGGLIDLTNSKLIPLIIGDLHGNLENLRMILNDNGNLDLIKNNKAMLIIVGDAVHNDQLGQMLEMKSSLTILEYIFELLITYPKNILYIRGNHDTFDERVRKSSIAQGLEMRKYLQKVRNEEFIMEVNAFFENLPMLIIGTGYVITHAGPVRGGITREELINIKDYPEKYLQLMWNRVHEFRGTPNQKEYGEEDIRQTLQKLNVPEDSYFIVGHNPLWNTGDKTGVWTNVLGINKHHIIYSGSGSKAPYFLFQDNELILKFAFIKKEEVYQYGPR
jgi:hypothetical protein